MTKANSTTSVSIQVAPAVARLLRANQIDLFDALSKDAQLKGKVERAQSSGGQTGTRADPLTILASAALVLAIGSALERLIRICTRSPAMITTRHNKARLNAEGNPLKDDGGKVLYDLTEEQQFVEPGVSDPFKLSAVATPGRVEFHVGVVEENSKPSTTPAPAGVSRTLRPLPAVPKEAAAKLEAGQQPADEPRPTATPKRQKK